MTKWGTLDKHFNEEKHKDFVEFCKSTGLRREELKYLTGDKLVYRNGKPYIIVNKGSKGGRYREAPVRGNIELVEKKMQEAGTNKVFEKIPSHADIHSYRADYATAYYEEIARDVKDIPFDKINKGSGFKYQSEVYTGQLKVLSTNKPVNILCFKGNLLIGNYFSYGQSVLFGHNNEINPVLGTPSYWLLT